MWQLASAVLLVVSFTTADPQGYNYVPPSQPFPLPGGCKDVTSVIYSTAVRDQVIPTTLRQYNTQYATTTIYSQRVVPTTLYQTQFQTRVQYETSVVQRQSQVAREQIETRTQQGYPVVQTRYETSVRVVPQVSYVVRTQISTQVVPVERTNIRYETRYQDQVQYQTVPVQQTSVLRVPGRDVLSTNYRTEYQTSVVQRQLPAATRYATTTLVDNRIETQTVPSPPVYRTSVVQSQRVIPTTLVRQNVQTRYATQTRYVTRTQYITQTQYQTQVVPQEVLVTVDVPREVLRTQYTTQFVPQTQVQTRYETQYRTGYPEVRTQQAYATSVVRVPGQDQVITREVINTQARQQVVYHTENVQRQVVVTRTVTQPCATGGYNYPEPAVQLNL